MKNYFVKKSTLKGEIVCPSSKSQTMRAILFASLAKGNPLAVEIEKPCQLEYWKSELNKLNIEKQKRFVCKWLRCIDDKEYNVDRIFESGRFNQKELIKLIVKIAYSYEDQKCDRFVILGNGTNIKVIKNQSDFSNKIDKGEIEIMENYFRINQPAYEIGWYIR